MGAFVFWSRARRHHHRDRQHRLVDVGHCSVRRARAQRLHTQEQRPSGRGGSRGGRLLMKVDSYDYENGDHRGDYPIHYETERGPPPGICNVLTAMLPKVLEPVAEQPDR
jgi:hypothetical protein